MNAGLLAIHPQNPLSVRNVKSESLLVLSMRCRVLHLLVSILLQQAVLRRLSIK